MKKKVMSIGVILVLLLLIQILINVYEEKSLTEVLKRIDLDSVEHISVVKMNHIEINQVTEKDKELLVQSLKHIKLKRTKEKYLAIDSDYTIILSTLGQQYSISLQANDRILVINDAKNENFKVEESNIFVIVEKIISEVK